MHDSQAPKVRERAWIEKTDKDAGTVETLMKEFVDGQLVREEVWSGPMDPPVVVADILIEEEKQDGDDQ